MMVPMLASQSPRMRPALFLDRDGILNIDKGYVSQTEEFVWVEGAIDLIKKANKSGWLVIILTNQSGIGREYYAEKDVKYLHKWVQNELKRQNAHIDAFYYCPFHDDATTNTYQRLSYNRKPAPGMLYRAQCDFEIDTASSVMFGDKNSDIQAADAAGVLGHLFEGGNVFDFAVERIKFEI